MDTIGMDSYPFIAAAAAAVIVVPEQDRVLLVGRRKGNPSLERVFGPPEAGKPRSNRPFTHARSPRDNPELSRSFQPLNHSEIPPPETRP